MSQTYGMPVGDVHASVFAHQTALHAITSGNNGAYNANAGWDPCTGLGSPNGDWAGD